MPTHLDHPVDYDKVDRHEVQRERQLTWPMIALAFAALVVVAIWAAMAGYL